MIRARAWAWAWITSSIQVAWFVAAAAGLALTLRLEEALDALGAGPGLAARALDAWFLLPLLAGAAFAARRAWRGSGPAASRALRGAPPVVTALLLCALFASGRGYWLHRFAPVREGVLYRSAQLGAAALESAVAGHGIRTLVSLRSEPELLARERSLAERLGLRFEHVPMHDTAAGVARFLEIVADPSARPVLVHCQYGVARTGVASAAFRMEYDGWDNERALAEARRFAGYDGLEDGSSRRAFILSYAPRQRTAGVPPPPAARPR